VQESSYSEYAGCGQCGWSVGQFVGCDVPTGFGSIQQLLCSLLARLVQCVKVQSSRAYSDVDGDKVTLPVAPKLNAGGAVEDEATAGHALG